MKRTTINRHSKACEAAFRRYEQGEFIDVVAIPNARQHGLEGESLGLMEWHHGAGRKIYVFCKTADEVSRAKALQEAAKERKQKALFTSKAGAWRWLEENGLTQDAGYGGIEYRVGKYGKFRCSYGESDGVIYYPCAESARAANILL